MQTQAQKRFDTDYAVLRKLLLSGKLIGGQKWLRNWIRVRGLQAAAASEIEVMISKKIAEPLKRQSRFELDLMDQIHEKDGYDKEDDKDE